MKLIILALILNGYLFAQSSEITVEQVSAMADSLTKVQKYEEAKSILEKADKKFPDNWELKWRLSRSVVDLGAKMPSETDEEKEVQLAVYEKALLLADEAVKLAPEKSVVYLRRGIVNGRIALFKGVFSVSDVAQQIKTDLEKAIELGNGGNEIQAVCHYVYARTHAKISEKWAPARSVIGLGWADIEVALDHFKKSVELMPTMIMARVDYAKALVREDKYNEAKVQLEESLKLKSTYFEDTERLKEAKELLVTVNKELN